MEYCLYFIVCAFLNRFNSKFISVGRIDSKSALIKDWPIDDQSMMMIIIRANFHLSHLAHAFGHYNEKFTQIYKIRHLKPPSWEQNVLLKTKTCM
jgi:hypothetical protein